MSSLAQRAFLELLDGSVRDARLAFDLGDDGRIVVGAGDDPPEVTVRVRDPSFFSRVLAHGNLGMGEAYMDRQFEMVEGSLTDFLTVLVRNRLEERLREGLGLRAAFRLLWIRFSGKLRGRLGNISLHYDLPDDDLFESFMDPSMQYSCGYVEDPEGGIERFQTDKMRRICEKLRLEPGLRLLETGCGYGGLLIYAAREFGVTGKGITIGRRHYERSRRNVADAGLGDRIEIEFCPYEKVSGEFDRVVSVEMMEHLDRREYGRYTRIVRDALTPRGMGLFQFIGCPTARNDHDPFIQKYILPDTSQPKLSEVAAELEKHDMGVLDVESMTGHYAHTLDAWAERFRRNAGALDRTKYDERFQRMFLYYLECAAAAARSSAGALYQVLFAKNFPDPMPLRRV